MLVLELDPRCRCDLDPTQVLEMIQVLGWDEVPTQHFLAKAMEKKYDFTFSGSDQDVAQDRALPGHRRGCAQKNRPGEFIKCFFGIWVATEIYYGKTNQPLLIGNEPKPPISHHEARVFLPSWDVDSVAPEFGSGGHEEMRL